MVNIMNIVAETGWIKGGASLREGKPKVAAYFFARRRTGASCCGRLVTVSEAVAQVAICGGNSTMPSPRTTRLA